LLNKPAFFRCRPNGAPLRDAAARAVKRFLPDGRNPLLLFGLCVVLAPGELAAQNAQIALNHASGFYASAIELTISTPVHGAAIYFTTNGSAPTLTTGLRYHAAIPISTTAIIRAAAFLDGRSLGEATRTYLFIPTILQQTAAQFPMTWGTNAGWLVPAHYRISAAIAGDAASRTLAESLRAIPSLSVVTAPESLFSPTDGIYVHPLARGEKWERPVNVELFDAQGRTVFQINCGLRIHGGMSRHPQESPKHSFRLAFKRRHGLPKLRVSLFGPGGAQEFDELVLRAGSNDSWLDTNGAHRDRATYLRDEWMRRSLRDMGHPSARGIFVHLYLNGLYWGIYNLCERPGPSLLTAGDASAYDFRRADELESGDSVAWEKMMALANGGLAAEHGYHGIGQYLDLTEFVDYLILNFYAGNADWDRSANWCAIRPRIPGGKFQFLVWDAERILNDPYINTMGSDDDESPMRLFHKLSENAGFRSFFAERARRLLLGNGPLSPEAAETRFRALTTLIEKALPAESARWGTYRKEVHQYKTGPFENYTPNEHWQPEVNRILTDFFSRRREILLDQFRERGLFPPAPANKPPGN